MENILVTGGLGFIGSHVCSLLLNNNYRVVIVDNLVNSKKSTLDKIRRLSNNENVMFYNADLSCESVDNVFVENTIQYVIHFAGLKSVSESIENPLLYYNTNIQSTISLLKTMEKHSCTNLIFSSSATVYGNISKSPICEDCKVGEGITSPYGQTKYMIEKILTDYARMNGSINITILRYFNPIGAHPSGLLGEDPNNIPTNLMPHILGVAYETNVNKKQDTYLSVFGSDYNTKDGTCIRDYIHVMDLAGSHILCIEKTGSLENNLNVFNVGLGRGTSVLELVRMFEAANDVTVPCKIEPRRAGDLDRVYCNSEKIQSLLGFSPTYSIKDMCKDAWKYKLNSMNS